MPEDIGDIEKWRFKYSFLNEIWKVYDEFDKTTKDDEHENLYTGVCEPIIRTYSKDKEKYKNFCLKLVRNLGCYPGDTNFFNPNSSKCHILYYWIYNYEQKHKIPDDVIQKCFKDYISFMGNIGQKANCNYPSYDEIYKEPMSLILLDIFEYSIDTIRGVLMHSDESAKIPYQNYVCEFVKTYKDVYKKYCPNRDANDIKGKTTCSRLSTLKQIYESYFFSLGGLNNKVPPLNCTDEEYFARCPSEERLPAIEKDADDRLSELSSAGRYSGEKPPDALPSGEVIDENTGSSMSRTVSTAVGTMAGASSVLALLYKFTPGRKWIHSGLGGRRARIGSNLYEDGASELLYNGLESEDFSSYNQRYDIGYSPV
ncbi:Plasmodium vivax Vir protein, putative [Plasmodium vivax]|nr:Plasmodium vivax Vir protein, putative [Plasmodium vivax]